MKNTDKIYLKKSIGYTFIIVFSWLAIHIYSVFFHSLDSPIWKTLILILIQCWLYAGIFIVAHDAMHRSLFPNNHSVNDMVGKLIVFIYAGFNWEIMRSSHHSHHNYSGTENDPDYYTKTPQNFWPWYLNFFSNYFGIKQVLVMIIFTLVYIFILGANYENTIVMWALPAILSSFQLFYFGTYLTHRNNKPFADTHNARTNDFPLWLSLLTCFHFGYHHEHHLYPYEPWWRLPHRKAK